MRKYQVEILVAAWQDIDKISDFYLKMVGAASAEKITNHINAKTDYPRLLK